LTPVNRHPPSKKCLQKRPKNGLKGELFGANEPGSKFVTFLRVFVWVFGKHFGFLFMCGKFRKVVLENTECFGRDGVPAEQRDARAVVSKRPPSATLFPSHSLYQRVALERVALGAFLTDLGQRKHAGSVPPWAGSRRCGGTEPPTRDAAKLPSKAEVAAAGCPAWGIQRRAQHPQGNAEGFSYMQRRPESRN